MPTITKPKPNTKTNFIKADGFANISLTLPNGKKVALGGLPLYASKALHAALLENAGSLDKFADAVTISSINLAGGAESEEEIKLF